MSSLSFLITRPNHDLVTNYLYFWSEKIIEKAKKYNITRYDLYKEKANRKTFLSYLKKNNPKNIFFNGHGNSKQIMGINDEVIVESNKDEKFLKGKIIYARSCRAARIFGKNCIKKGAEAFIGYKSDFFLISTPEKTTKPLLDRVAGYFLELSNLVMITLLKGKTPQESYKRSQNDSIKKIKYLISPKISFEEKSLLPFLWRNMRAQVLLEK